MSPIRILVDADACPVKDEIYRVAERHKVPVSVVSNSPFRVPVGPLVERVVVSGGFDAADDWIAERVLRQAQDERIVVVTGDILLADRCLKAGASVLAPNGRPFTSASIGSAIATRAIMADLRAGMGEGLAGRRRLPRRTGRGFCRCWMSCWCGSGGRADRSGTELVPLARSASGRASAPSRTSSPAAASPTGSRDAQPADQAAFDRSASHLSLSPSCEITLSSVSSVGFPFSLSAV